MIDNTLEHRGKIYGDYSNNVDAVADIMKTLKTLHLMAHDDIPMASADEANLYYIVIKLVRLGVSPDHLDSWHDLQGYAKLAEGYYGKHD